MISQGLSTWRNCRDLDLDLGYDLDLYLKLYCDNFEANWTNMKF